MHTLPHIYKQRDNGTAMFYTWFSAMHTRVDIALISNQPEQALADLSSNICKRVDNIERMASCFRDDSELTAINRSAGQQPVAISPELEHILKECAKYNAMTRGLFDITAAAGQTHAGCAADIILPGDGTISFRRRDLYINLSGYLKGYALEQTRTILTTFGIDNALVNMGNSSIMAIGNMNGDNGWTVAFNTGNTNHTTLRNSCLTTSGNNTYTRKHIIDPRTGRLIEGQRAIAIINSNATEGEVLSTGLFIGTDIPFSGFKPYRIISNIY